MENDLNKNPYKIEFSEEQLKILTEIVKFAYEFCPVEGLSLQVDITSKKVQSIIEKLEQYSNR